MAYSNNGSTSLINPEGELDLPVWSVHIEVRLKPTAVGLIDAIRRTVKDFLSQDDMLSLHSTVTGWDRIPLLQKNVDLIRVTESTCPRPFLPPKQASLEVHVYQPNEAAPFEEFTSTIDGAAGEDTMAGSICELPSKALDGIWDTLIYPDNIKSDLLNYIYATLLLSDNNVDFNIVSWNRVVLLHGPPGTGKTSLCRALAQKLAIRLDQKYPRPRLVEINSHSLFSRWFSESGKLVQKLFSSINEMVDDEESFVVLLIDEVESLTAARAGAMAGNEPSDALRVVNALLTQLDKLKHRKNVLVMATSNLVDAIDPAFVDRADIVQYVGLPPPEGVYSILQSCVVELCRVGIISPITLLDPSSAARISADIEHTDSESRAQVHASARLLALATKCVGMSGRSLRRLPVLAHARHIGTSAIGARASDIEVWLDAMTKVVQDEATQRLFFK